MLIDCKEILIRLIKQAIGDDFERSLIAYARMYAEIMNKGGQKSELDDIQNDILIYAERRIELEAALKWVVER